MNKICCHFRKNQIAQQIFNNQLRHMSKPEKVVCDKLIGSKIQIGDITLEDKDAMLYALGIGFNMDPLREEDFKYTNEWSSDFTTFPTITTVMRLKPSLQLLIGSPYMPEFALHQLLHAEQKLYMIQPKIKIGVTYRQQVEVVDVADKGKNAFFYTRQTAYAKDGKGKETKAFYSDRTFFIRGIGGFGFKGKGATAVIPDSPKRNPDFIFKDKTFPSQAFFYRLCEDTNPLHIDPSIAALGGFERPIIHGMVSYGTIARNLIQNMLKNDPDVLQAFEAKLIGHVFPGESFEIKVWKEGNKLLFLAEVAERKTKAMIGALTFRENAKL